jgi:prepilin-type N-terminal cleavage/methylation domain-containing protein
MHFRDCCYRRRVRDASVSPRSRSGFTLLEVIVAIVLIDVGLLSLVAGSAVLIRRSTETRAETLALHAANNRLEALRSGSCAVHGLSSGVALGASFREDWSIEPQAAGTRDLRDSISFVVQRRAHSIVLRTRISC